MKVTKTGIAKHISDALQDHEPPMTIKDLKDKTGIGLSKLKRIVSGEIDKNGNKRLPTTDDLLEIANALGVSPYKLLTGNDNENHVVCEELGLSNETINKLKSENRKDRLHYMQLTIDALVVYPPVLLAMASYLFYDSGTMEGDDNKGIFHHLDKYAFERLERLTILDEIEVCKVKINAEGRKGK